MFISVFMRIRKQLDFKDESRVPFACFGGKLTLSVLPHPLQLREIRPAPCLTPNNEPKNSVKMRPNQATKCENCASNRTILCCSCHCNRRQSATHKRPQLGDLPGITKDNRQTASALTCSLSVSASLWAQPHPISLINIPGNQVCAGGSRRVGLLTALAQLG